VSSGLCTLLVATNYARGLLGLFEFALLLATVTVLVPYAFTALAQIVLILREPGRWGGPDRGRALVTSVLGLAFSLAAIVWSGWSSVLWGGVLLAGGVPFYLWSVRRRASRGLLPPRPSG
jgi:APA family basic amino acid/polyamine antiporter